MSHKKKVRIVRKFLKEARAWVNKMPGAISVTTNIGGKNIVLAEKNHKKC